MFVLSLVAALTLGDPLPAPAAGGETFSEAVDALRAGPTDPERARALYARAAAQATAPPYSLVVTQLRAQARLADVKLDEVPPDRPLPSRLPRLTADGDEALAIGAAAASLAYEDEVRIRAQLKTWGYREPRFFENAVPGTRAFLAERADHAILAFCGTEAGVADPMVDLSADRISGGRYGGGRVHRGFHVALESVWAEVEAALAATRRRAPGRPLIIAGHSLGGALATLTYARERTALHYPSLPSGAPSARLVSVGAPRVGDADFAALPVFRPDASFRVVYRHDPVPHLLSRGLGFRHPERATTLWIDDARVLHRIAAEDPARDEFPQDLDPVAWRKWWSGPDTRPEDHNECNYSVILNRAAR